MHGWLGISAGALAGLETLALIADVGTGCAGPRRRADPIGLMTLPQLSKSQIAGTAIVTQLAVALV